MADNVVVTAGSGTTVHADEYTHGTLGSGKTQLVKLVDGTLDSGAAIAVDVGVKANALRVAPANNITDATYIGDIKFGEALPAGTNEIGKLAAGTAGIGKLIANSGVDIGDVDVTSIIPLTGATNLGKARDSALGATDTGVMALAIRDDTLTTLTPIDGDYVPLRVSSVGALHVTGGGGGTEYTEDVATANPIIGSATLVERDDALGGLTPAEGDWATLYCDANGALWTHDNALDAALDGSYLNVNLNFAGTDATAGEGVITAQTQRVTLATDDDGVAHLATIAGDTTSIDGNITACNTGAVVLSSGTVTTVSTVTNLAQMGGAALAMNEGALGVGVQRVSLATDDDAVASLGIIDDWDAVHASAVSSDGPQVMGAAYSTGLPTDVGADADAARICTDRFGRVLPGLMPQNFQATITSVDATTAEPVKVKTASRKMYILSLTVSTDTAMSIQFQDDTGPTVLIEQMYFAANGGAHLNFPAEAPLVVNTNEDFDVLASVAGNISVTITGYLAV